MAWYLGEVSTVLTLGTQIPEDLDARHRLQQTLFTEFNNSVLRLYRERYGAGYNLQFDAQASHATSLVWSSLSLPGYSVHVVKAISSNAYDSWEVRLHTNQLWAELGQIIYSRALDRFSVVSSSSCFDHPTQPLPASWAPSAPEPVSRLKAPRALLDIAWAVNSIVRSRPSLQVSVAFTQNQVIWRFAELGGETLGQLVMIAQQESGRCHNPEPHQRNLDL